MPEVVVKILALHKHLSQLLGSLSQPHLVLPEPCSALLEEESALQGLGEGGRAALTIWRGDTLQGWHFWGAGGGGPAGR